MKFALPYTVFSVLATIYISYSFDISTPYNVIFMGAFCGALMGFMIRRNLFIYSCIALISLLGLNYAIVYYKFNDYLFRALSKNINNIFIWAAIILIGSLVISTLLFYGLRKIVDYYRHKLK